MGLNVFIGALRKRGPVLALFTEKAVPYTNLGRYYYVDDP